MRYCYQNHPDVMLQLIPYGEDTAELLRYGEGDPMSGLVARYAQARFSAYPNVMWCVSNDREIVREDDQAVLMEYVKIMQKKTPFWGGF